MNPLRLQAQGYRSFADLDLELPEGTVAIVGPNGAGKSSIVNAIELCLFGGRLADYLCDDGTQDLALELTFTHAGAVFRVRRSYSAKGRGKTTCDFEQYKGVWFGHGSDPSYWESRSRETAKETQAEIERELGFTRDTWRASSFLAQGDGAAFCEADPRDRKRILSEAVLGRDPVWPRLLEAVRADMRIANTRIAEIAGALERAEAELAHADMVQQELKHLTDAATATASELERAEQRCDQVGLQIRDLEAATAERRTAEAKLAQARAHAAQLEQQHHDGEFAAGELPDLDNKIRHLDVLVAKGRELEEANDLVREQRVQWQQRKAERDRLLDEVKKIAAAADELRRRADHIGQHIGESQACDRCGQTLGVEAATRAVKSFLDEAEEMTAAGATLYAQAEAVKLGVEPAEPQPIPEEIRNAAGELGAARERRTQLAARAEAAKTPDFLRQLREARSALAAHEADLAQLPAVDEAAVEEAQKSDIAARSTLALARQRQQEAGESLARAKAEHERLVKLAEQTRTDRGDRDRLLGELDQLAILERAYSPNGIPALILENTAIPSIEVEANRVLQQLAGDGELAGARIELLTQRELKSRDGLAETLDISIVTENGARRRFEMWSGGEKERINLALRIGLASFMANRRGAESKFLALDEPEGIDEQGRSFLVEFLQSSLNRGVEKAYLISHNPDLRDAFDQRIEVERDGAKGPSRIVGAVTAEAAPA